VPFPFPLRPQLLVDKGSNVEAAGNDGKSPMHLAAESGHRSVAQVLRNGSAKLDSRCRFWQLHFGKTFLGDFFSSSDTGQNFTNNYRQKLNKMNNCIIFTHSCEKILQACVKLGTS
jgi:ankyrin repeat protein